MYFRLASAEDHQINDLWIYAQNANHGHKQTFAYIAAKSQFKATAAFRSASQAIDISHGGSMDNGAWVYASYRTI